MCTRESSELREISESKDTKNIKNPFQVYVTHGMGLRPFSIMEHDATLLISLDGKEYM